VRKKKPSKEFQPSRRTRKLTNQLDKIRQTRRQQAPEERLNELRGRGFEKLSFKDPLTGEFRSVWQEIERDVRFGGQEWQIPLPPDFLKEIEGLERKGKYKEARLLERQRLEALVTHHFQRNQHLLEVFVKHPNLIYPWTAWLAVRLWTDNEAVCHWLVEDIVPKALSNFSPRTSTLTKEDLKQEAAAGLANALAGDIPKVRGKITAYLSTIARNAALALLRKSPPGRSLDQKAFLEGEETQKDLLHDEKSLEDLGRILDAAISSREWAKLKNHLTPREWLLISHASTPRRELAQFLDVDERQVRRYWAELRKKAEKILGRK